LTNWIVADWRRHDDLIEEENDIVQEALRRLPADEMYRRAYRIRIAQQCGVTHTELPRDQWTKPEEVNSVLDGLTYI
jgi:ubiquinol-cytochrome c reductase subunit 7